MKVNVIHDQNGNLIAALRADPQKLADGREVSPVFRLKAGQTSRTVDVADGLSGDALLKQVSDLRPTL